jgi:hypothetical protein
MNSLPQGTIQNPAFYPNYKFSIGFPGSSIAIQASNNGFSFNDLVRKQGDSLVVDITKWSNALAKKNYITTTADIDAFRLQFKVKDNWLFMANVTGRSYGRFMFPKDLVLLASEGTAKFIGQTADISPQANGMGWIEVGLGASRKINDRLRVGMRAKYLLGVANVYTEHSKVTLDVGDNYYLTARADMSVISSGLSNEKLDFVNQIKNNRGLGVDFGATYQLTDKLSIQASITDLGYIRWKQDLTRWTWDPEVAYYTFKGFDTENAFNNNGASLEDQLDSLATAFEANEKKGGLSYKTALPTKIFIGANYRLVKNLTGGLVAYTETYQGRISPGVTASVNKQFGKVLSLSVSYSMSNRTYANFGAGMSLNLAPVQFYLVGDNLLNAPISLIANADMNNYLKNSQVTNIRAGLNFVWGWRKENNNDNSPAPAPPKEKKSKKLNNEKAIDLRKKG